jgi:hopanoid biosynthesis associated radical SAM protein HpnH
MIHKKFPLVLMLEPLHACNLTCTGCGRIREYEDSITEKLTWSNACGRSTSAARPSCRSAGGEPLLYPELAALVRGCWRGRKHIYLCTNGLLHAQAPARVPPDPRLFFNVHLDGMEKTTTRVERPGVFREAIEAIRAAKAAGFKVSTNTTVYKDTDMKEIERLFEFLRTSSAWTATCSRPPTATRRSTSARSS